jgi:hypothetical protein
MLPEHIQRWLDNLKPSEAEQEASLINPEP